MPTSEFAKVCDNSIHLCLDGCTWEHYLLRKYHAPIVPVANATVIIIENSKVSVLKHRDDIKRIREDFHDGQGVRFRKHFSRVASAKTYRPTRLTRMGTQSTFEYGRDKNETVERRIHIRIS